jgi:hypothetical protein
MKTFCLKIALLLLVLPTTKVSARNLFGQPAAFFQEVVSDQKNPLPSARELSNGYDNEFGDPGLRMTVFAGNDTTICLTASSFPIHGHATDYYYVSWEKTGDGFFDNHTQLQTTYTPGPGDVATGVVVLYLVAINNTPIYTRMVDSVEITIVPAPQCFAGYDDAVCKGEMYQLQGEASYFSSLQWLSTGDGTFDNLNQLSPIYTPGTGDCLNGAVSLLLIANTVAPCTLPHVNSMNLIIIEPPEVLAGSDTLLCEGVYSLTAATATNYQSLLWHTSGDGTFSDATELNSIYSPGTGDLIGNEIYLVLQAFPNQPCLIAATDSITLQVMAKPWVYAGEDRTICAGDIVNCTGQGQDYEQIHWLTYGGNGTFEYPDSLTTTYTPDQYEIETGLCYLVLRALPNYPCSVAEYSFMSLVIIKEPTLQLPDQIISVTDTVGLLAEPQSYLSCQWATSGDGIFEDATSPATVYYAGHNDLQQRQVYLSLTALPFSPCQSIASDTVLAGFEYPVVIADNMPDQTLVAGEILEMEFEVESLAPGQYRWYRNGVWQQNISGSEYFVPQVSAIDAGAYHCIFNNPYITFSSDTAHLSVLEQATQTLTIPAGWSAISSCIIPPNAEIFTVLQPIIGKIIVIYNDSGIMFPHSTKNDLDHWATHAGYYIKTTESCTLTIQGYQQYPAPVFRTKSGWSLLPVNSLQQIPSVNLIGCHPEITAIKEVAGTKVYWPGKGINTLQNLQPGKAYEIYNSANYNVTIRFPGCN